VEAADAPRGRRAVGGRPASVAPLATCRSPPTGSRRSRASSVLGPRGVVARRPADVCRAHVTEERVGGGPPGAMVSAEQMIDVAGSGSTRPATKTPMSSSSPTSGAEVEAQRETGDGMAWVGFAPRAGTRRPPPLPLPKSTGPLCVPSPPRPTASPRPYKQLPSSRRPPPCAAPPLRLSRGALPQSLTCPLPLCDGSIRHHFCTELV